MKSNEAMFDEMEVLFNKASDAIMDIIHFGNYLIDCGAENKTDLQAIENAKKALNKLWNNL